MGAFEDGSSFLAGVLAKVPEDLRAQVKAAFERPEAKDAVTLLGDGVLARSDYSKHMDQLRAQEQRAKEGDGAPSQARRGDQPLRAQPGVVRGERRGAQGVPDPEGSAGVAACQR